MLTYRRTLSDQPPSPTFPLRYEPDTREYNKRHRDTARNNATNDDRSVRGGRLFSRYQARKRVTSVTSAIRSSENIYHATEEIGSEILNNEIDSLHADKILDILIEIYFLYRTLCDIAFFLKLN